MIRIFHKCWDIAVALALAAAAGKFLQPDALKDVTAELITFFGIQSAVALPAMIFTAGMLRPDGITVTELRRYLGALRLQMRLWIALLVLDLLASILVVVGKIAGWKLVIHLPWAAWNGDISWVYLVLLTFTGCLAALRIIPFVQGILSLLELNGELTEKAIMMRVREKLEQDERKTEAVAFQAPDGYGRIRASR